MDLIASYEATVSRSKPIGFSEKYLLEGDSLVSAQGYKFTLPTSLVNA